MIAAALLLAATLVPIPSPAGAGSGEPFLFATKHDVILSWLEGNALRYARYDGAKWSEPKTLVQRDDLLVNWADFPSVVEDANGVLYAQWLQKRGHGYDAWMKTSRSEPARLNRGDAEGEYGFVSLAPMPKGGVAATWLAEGTLRFAIVEGVAAKEQVLDDRTCECCATGMAMTSSGPLIVYRDRSADEIRDIAYVRPGGKPRILHADNWKINGCPVNGPQIDAIGERYAVAWFTQSGVYAQFDGGQPLRVDDGHPIGRVDVVMLDGDSAVVSWMEETEIRARKVSRAGSEPSIRIAGSSSARSSGFPRIARRGRDVFFAWTEGKRVQVGRVRF